MFKLNFMIKFNLTIKENCIYQIIIFKFLEQFLSNRFLMSLYSIFYLPPAILIHLRKPLNKNLLAIFNIYFVFEK